MQKVKGENVLVLFYDGGNTKIYACATGCELKIDTEIVETSEVGSGDWQTNRTVKNSFSGNIKGLVNYDQPTMLSLFDLRNKQTNFTKLKMVFQRLDEAGNDKINEGDILITNSSESAAFDGLATFDVEFKGTGKLITI
jgi:predicted secreted protein